jgi:CMP-N-acetylneuraminic acid synthetase
MYVCKTALITEQRSLYGDRSVPLVMNALHSLDIDTEIDWQIAEALLTTSLNPSL